jgi:FdhE protein
MTEATAREPGRGGIGEPDFARLPDPQRLFARRAERFRALAGGHPLGPYLTFLSRIADAQHRVQAALPAPALPDQAGTDLRLANGMPVFSKDDLADEFAGTLDRLCRALDLADAPPPAMQALARLTALPWEERRALADAVFDGTYPAEQLGECLYVAAALQIHLGRLASRIDPGRLRPVGAAVCPACGSVPAASVIVGWAKADHARYCVCALCGTWWNYVRIKCTSCEATSDITYYTIEEQSKDHAAEACGVCRAYIKHLHQERDPAIEASVDDIASFGLDVKMRDDGYHRAQANPFMVGL